MPTLKSTPVAINGELHDAYRLDVNYETGFMVVDLDLSHLVGEEVTYRIGSGPWYTGLAIVSEVHAPKDEPVTAALRLHGPAVRVERSAVTE